MSNSGFVARVCTVVMFLGLAGGAWANVFFEPSGTTSLDLVPVGNPGNPGISCGDGGASAGPVRICGAVSYDYSIGKYEVTAAQYAEFLNAVAKTDPDSLWHSFMTAAPSSQGCMIARSGSSGSFSYSVASDYANLPVNYVTWGDMARFCNWLTNGQPTGPQGTATTEDGSYHFTGTGVPTSAQLLAVTRQSTAIFVIPNEDEWVKAAYYDPAKPGGAGYWQFGTMSNSTPVSTTPFTTANDANYSSLGGPTHYRTPAGSFVNTPSPYGTFDQNGNINEFTEGIDNFSGSTFRVLRGGGYTASFGEDRFIRQGGNPASIGQTTGFRIAQIAPVPEPSGTVLVLGGIALLARRKKITK